MFKNFVEKFLRKIGKERKIDYESICNKGDAAGIIINDYNAVKMIIDWSETKKVSDLELVIFKELLEKTILKDYITLTKCNEEKKILFFRTTNLQYEKNYQISLKHKKDGTKILIIVLKNEEYVYELKTKLLLEKYELKRKSETIVVFKSGDWEIKGKDFTMNCVKKSIYSRV